VPVGLAVLVLTLWKIPESKSSQQAPGFDWLGALLATLAFGGIVVGLIESKTLALVAGVAALFGLWYREAHSNLPMVPLGLFRSRNFTGANLLTLFLYSALSGVLFFFPLNLIQVQGYSPTEAGAAILPFILLMFLLSRWSGGLVDLYGAKLPLIAGSFIAAGGFALFARPGIGGEYWTTFFPAVLVLGLGMAICVAPLTTTVMNAVDRIYAGTASGINNAVLRIASVLAIAVFGALLSGVFRTAVEQRLTSVDLSPAVRSQIESQLSNLAAAKTDDERGQPAIKEAFVAGFRSVLWLSAGLAIVSSISAATLIRDPRRARPRSGAV